jgi:hypothetical protein
MGEAEVSTVSVLLKLAVHDLSPASCVRLHMDVIVEPLRVPEHVPSVSSVLLNVKVTASPDWVRTSVCPVVMLVLSPLGVV